MGFAWAEVMAVRSIAVSQPRRRPTHRSTGRARKFDAGDTEVTLRLGREVRHITGHIAADKPSPGTISGVVLLLRCE